VFWLGVCEIANGWAVEAVHGSVCCYKALLT